MMFLLVAGKDLVPKQTGKRKEGPGTETAGRGAGPGSWRGANIPSKSACPPPRYYLGWPHVGGPTPALSVASSYTPQPLSHGALLACAAAWFLRLHPFPFIRDRQFVKTKRTVSLGLLINVNNVLID